MSHRALSGQFRERDESFDVVKSHPWFHGTDHRSAEAISANQKAEVGPLQQYGPGMYVTPDWFNAETYARMAAKSRGSDVPIISEGSPKMDKPISLKATELETIGKNFRRKNPRVSEDWSDTALGNIALRKKGFDFLHVAENVSGSHNDTGVILRPKSWVTRENHEV